MTRHEFLKLATANPIGFSGAALANAPQAGSAQQVNPDLGFKDTPRWRRTCRGTSTIRPAPS